MRSRYSIESVTQLPTLPIEIRLLYMGFEKNIFSRISIYAKNEGNKGNRVTKSRLIRF